MQVARRYRFLAVAAALSRHVGWTLVALGALGLLALHGRGPWAIGAGVTVIWVGLMLALVVSPTLHDRLARFDPVWLVRSAWKGRDRTEAAARITYAASVGLYRIAAVALAVAILSPALGGRGILPPEETLMGHALVLAVLSGALGWVVRGIHAALRAPLVAVEAARDVTSAESESAPSPAPAVPETEMWVRVRGGSVGYTVVTPTVPPSPPWAERPPAAGERAGRRLPSRMGDFEDPPLRR